MERVYTLEQLNAYDECCFCGIRQMLKKFVAILSGKWVCQECHDANRNLCADCLERSKV